MACLHPELLVQRLHVELGRREVPEADAAVAADAGVLLAVFVLVAPPARPFDL
eukprot:COSAG01_NODE_28988_length_648_cov_0.468124_1_plen_52_part_10